MTPRARSTGEPTRDVMRTVIRSICAQLDIDNTKFGVLSGGGDDDDLD